MEVRLLADGLSDPVEANGFVAGNKREKVSVAKAGVYRSEP